MTFYRKNECSASESESKKGSDVSKIVNYIFNFINSHPDLDQFSLQSIINEFQADNKDVTIPTLKWIKQQLFLKLEDDIFIASNNCQETIIFRRKAGNKILMKHFKESTRDEVLPSEDSEVKTLKEAAEIIIRDVKNKTYDVHHYPAADQFFNGLDEYIPQSLFKFLWTLITHDKKQKQDWHKKISAIAHNIIAAMLPKKMISPLQLGLAVTLYHRYGSKDLIDILSSLGLCASYTKVSLFQASAINFQTEPIMQKCFGQFAFDNADHNVCTFDGFNTFHCMGGIQIIVPHNAIQHQSIPKMNKLPKSETFVAKGVVSLKYFEAHPEKRFQDLRFQTLHGYDLSGNKYINNIQLSDSDFLWLYSKFHDIEKSTGWNHFMEEITAELSFQRSRVICLPFICAPPSNKDTVYTSLLLACEKAASSNLPYVYATFDLPLYMKALEVIATSEDHRLKNVVPILGGFHLLMSYMGAIGHVMDGSGIKDILSLIYAENSIKHILTGHAFARALQAHVQIHAALAHLILSSIVFTQAEKELLNALQEKVGHTNILPEFNNAAYQTVVKKFNDKLQEFSADNMPTGKLWVQYFQMVTLIKKFIEATRCTYWNEYLTCITQMLPIFHAAGHNLYAKGAHLFVQQMLQLSEQEHSGYMSNFSVRRTDKFYCAIFGDQTIETGLMKLFKDPGRGLTHGRGTDDSDIAKWILSMPIFVDIFQSCQEYCKVAVFGVSEQHKSDMHDDGGPTRVKKDNTNFEKLKSWLQDNSPFSNTEQLVSLKTGIVADAKIDCNKAFEIGTHAVESTFGKKIGDVKIGRKYRVQPLSIMTSKIKIDSKDVPIDPTLLFQRICLMKKDDDELKGFFQYELAPYPLSMFDENGMRKNTKSDFYNLFLPLQEKPTFQNAWYVIDGGYLLHKVVWPKKSTYVEIFQTYVNYIKKHYSETVQSTEIHVDVAEPWHI
ncbi:hypothetical protein ALC62_15043 [Cyphomyrmex costatus]|uniref:Uncharacterized protein n=1 Tax=Cyphomyrmex costatus TaxID=456900 RepID=A0A151I871_9HYME|nr:hypothetical protein ALC62_15043 [Cyphomyrmex costatus]